MSTPRITPEEAHDLMEDEDFVYVDVRSVPEFEAGHPEGAFNVPFLHRGPSGMAPNADFVLVMEANWPKDAKLVIACQAGGRSAKAVAVLEAAGFTELRDQFAGYGGSKDPFKGTVEPGWQATGLPMGLEPEPGHDYASLKAKVS